MPETLLTETVQELLDLFAGIFYGRIEVANRDVVLADIASELLGRADRSFYS